MVWRPLVVPISPKDTLAAGILLSNSNAVEHIRYVPRQGKFVEDRKSTRLNSSHLGISYAVFCLTKKRLPDPDGLSQSASSRSAIEPATTHSIIGTVS